jgi:hypothetical protein
MHCILAAVLSLNLSKGLLLENVQSENVTYRGRRAVRLTERPGVTAGFEKFDDALAIVEGSDFENGTIEVDVAGMPRPGAAESARGFVGIAFRMQPNGSGFEYFYIRPTNGRSDDQLRRNHATQYAEHPDFPWFRLRKETPGVYESYADLVPGAWTHIKIVVQGVHARFYVNGGEQPCLIVNDLKLGEARGQIGLWIGLDTEGYFSNLRVSRGE